MEAVTVAGRDRVWRVREAIASWGLGSWLLGLLVLMGLFAAFNNGATAIPQESRLQVGIAATGLICGIGISAGALRIGGSPKAWLGVALLGAFALWSALSVIWSAAPDETWIATNRAIAYAVVTAVALIAASNTRSAARGVAFGVGAAALVVALYALASKILPGLHVASFDLNPGDEFSRVRKPIGYWNAVGILCVMAAPMCIWLASFPDAPRNIRIASLLTLTVLVLTTATTYSRGALLAYAAVLVVMVGVGPQRLRRLAIGVGAIAAALPSMAIAFSLHDLATGGVPLGLREDGGAILGLVLLLSLGALGVAARELLRLEARTRWTGNESRFVWRALAVATLVTLIAGVGALAVSSRGLTGEISHQVESFKEPKAGPGNDPSRLISANGSNRWIWWQEALGAFKDKPLAGWGAGSFPVSRNFYRRYATSVRSTHSVPLQFLSETGLIGAALGLGGLGLLGAAAIRRVRAASGIERSARLALLAAATAWAVHSLVDWDWEIPAVTIPALVALAVSAAPTPAAGAASLGRRIPKGGSGDRGRASWASTGIAVASAVAAVLFVASAAFPSLSETKRVDALSAAGAGSVRDGASDAELSQKLDPLSIEPLFAQAGIAQSQGDQRRAGELLVKATDLQPDNFETWQRLAQFELTVNDNNAAARAIRRQAESNPLAFETRPNLGDLLYPLRVPPENSPTAFGTPPP